MKVINLPNGNAVFFRNTQEKISKLKDALAVIEKLFKKLRVIYTEYQKHVIEIDDITSLVPFMSAKEKYMLEILSMPVLEYLHVTSLKFRAHSQIII